MKTFRMIGMAFMAVLMCVNFTSCSKDDDDFSSGGGSNTSVNIPNNTIRYQTTDGDRLHFKNEDVFGGARIVKHTYSADDWWVLEFGSNVTAIEDEAFYDNETLLSIILPNSVTSIGEWAFSDCDSLTSVQNSNNVTSIGYGAFKWCCSLTSINIPNSVTSIGDYAFFCCDSLTNIKIPNSVASIGDYAFAHCNNFTNIEIPNSVTSIGKNMFYGCYNITSIVVGDGNEVYDSRNNCNAIIEKSTNTLVVGCKNTIIPNSVTNIGDYAFSDCKGLTSITIPNSVTSIGNEAFYACSDLTSITIPNSVTSIGERAFSYCRGLTSITIGNSVTSIGNEAFSGCTSLKDLRIEDGEATLSMGYESKGESGFGNGQGLFYDCPLESIYLGRNIEYQTNYIYGYSPFYRKDGLKSVTIGNSVTSIGNNAFCDCDSLTSITIPNSVTSIGDEAFGGCNKLSSIYFWGTTPPAISYDAFSMGWVYEERTVYVPQGSLAAYKDANVWNEFTNIVEFDPTGF